MVEKKKLKLVKIIAGLLLVINIPSILLLLAASFSLISESYPGSGIVGIVLAVPFVYISLKAFQTIRLCNRYMHYTETMLILHSGDTKAVAAKIGKPVDSVKADLRKMGRRGYFRKVRIDGDYDYINLPELLEYTQQMGRAGQRAERMVIVKCPHCGAEKLMPPGSVGECDYCQMSVQASAE